MTKRVQQREYADRIRREAPDALTAAIRLPWDLRTPEESRLAKSYRQAERERARRWYAEGGYGGQVVVGPPSAS